MSGEKNTTENYAIGVIPTMPWRVKAVKALPDYCLNIQFIDEKVHGEVDMSQLINSEKAGVFKALRDPMLFNKVTLEYGAVTWPGELDLAPDVMYQEIKQRGKWVIEA